MLPTLILNILGVELIDIWNMSPWSKYCATYCLFKEVIAGDFWGGFFILY
jgi:hypothetical protein